MQAVLCISSIILSLLVCCKTLPDSPYDSPPSQDGLIVIQTDANTREDHQQHHHDSHMPIELEHFNSPLTSQAHTVQQSGAGHEHEGENQNIIRITVSQADHYGLECFAANRLAETARLITEDVLGIHESFTGQEKNSESQTSRVTKTTAINTKKTTQHTVHASQSSTEKSQMTSFSLNNTVSASFSKEQQLTKTSGNQSTEHVSANVLSGDSLSTLHSDKKSTANSTREDFNLDHPSNNKLQATNYGDLNEPLVIAPHDQVHLMDNFTNQTSMLDSSEKDSTDTSVSHSGSTKSSTSTQNSTSKSSSGVDSSSTTHSGTTATITSEAHHTTDYGVSSAAAVLSELSSEVDTSGESSSSAASSSGPSAAASSSDSSLSVSNVASSSATSGGGSSSAASSGGSSSEASSGGSSSAVSSGGSSSAVSSGGSSAAASSSDSSSASTSGGSSSAASSSDPSSASTSGESSSAASSGGSSSAASSGGSSSAASNVGSSSAASSGGSLSAASTGESSLAGSGGESSSAASSGGFSSAASNGGSSSAASTGESSSAASSGGYSSAASSGGSSSAASSGGFSSAASSGGSSSAASTGGSSSVASSGGSSSIVAAGGSPSASASDISQVASSDSSSAVLSSEENSSAVSTDDRKIDTDISSTSDHTAIKESISDFIAGGSERMSTSDHEKLLDPYDLTGSDDYSFSDLNCTCVAYYMCKEEDIVTDGANLIQIRFKNGLDEPLTNSKCRNFLDVCCSSPLQRPDVTVTSNLMMNDDYEPKCGNRNQEGLSVFLEGFKDDETQFGEFPWMGIILENELSKLGVVRKYVCGGSLIHRQVVLTAAHCVFRKKYSDLIVRLGEWDTKHEKELFSHEEFDVTQMKVHAHFNSKTLFNDVALLQLDRQVTLKQYIDTVCLPSPALPSGAWGDQLDLTRCIATGYGKEQYHSGQYQNIMKRVELSVVPHEECQVRLRSTMLGRWFRLHDTFTCAGGEEGVDTCRGDGGSPLVCPSHGGYGGYTQVGIVAWGIGCGEEGIPGVYANVAQMMPWIKQNMGQLVDNPGKPLITSAAEKKIQVLEQNRDSSTPSTPFAYDRYQHPTY